MKTIKKMLSISVCLALIMSYVPMVSITAGAAETDITVAIDTGASVTLRDADGDGYYDIGTADELYAFAAAVNGGNTSIKGELTADIIVNQNVLTEDSELNGDGSSFRVWTPIGIYSERYKGTFNGGEHTISGLYFDDSSTEYVGLFGMVDYEGKIQNVGIIDSYINGYQHVGGVAGFSRTVTNCYNTGYVSGTNMNVGGVVGISAGPVRNCYNTGTVISDGACVGGVVGINGDTVTNCYNEGTVIGYSTSVGGVVGKNYSTSNVINSYNTGNVSGIGYVGGVVGTIDYGIMVNCYNTGTVSGRSSVGGVTGVSYGTVTNCYYLSGCATDGNSVTQLGIGSETVGSTTADITGQTDSKPADWFASGEVCTAVGYHCGSSATNGFCDVCGYDPATLNADGYYEISNAGQLFWFGNYINTVDRTANAILTADIDLESKALSPIGKDANKYAGVFDGQGHTISNFHINITSVGNWGLFGYIAGEGTVIKNFSINGDVTTALTSNVDVQYGVVGQADGGAEIRNVHSSVNLTSGDSYQKKYFGGIVGRTGNINVDMCSYNGTLSLGSNTLDCVGGIVGYVYNGKTAKITNCGFYGDIESTYTGGNIGGILGYYNGENAKALTISNCLSVGNLPSGRGAVLGTIKNYGSTNAGTNNHYFSDLTHTVTNVTAIPATQTQLKRGEVAYLLQAGNTRQVWGQMSNIEGSLPIITDNELYKVAKVAETDNYSVANVGDTNDDGTVDVTDYQSLVNMAVSDGHTQSGIASYNDIIRYDLDGDGYVDVLDASLMHLFINDFTAIDVYDVGDIDRNGVAFEKADINAIKNAIESPERLSTAEKYACDVSADGKVSEADFTRFSSLYSKINSFSVSGEYPMPEDWSDEENETQSGVQNAGKTAWENGDEILVSFATEDDAVKSFTFTYQDGNWVSDIDSITYYSDDAPVITAVYAPCFEATENGIELKENMQYGVGEYIAADATVNGNTLYIDFSFAQPIYSRLRIVAAAEQELTVITTGGFSPAGYDGVSAPESYTVKTDVDGNAYLYGVFAENSTVTVKNGGAVLAEHTFAEAPEVKKSYTLDTRIVAHYKVVNGKVVNIINGEEMENAVVDDEGYFSAGKVKLPSSYEKASVEAVMVYNKASTDSPVGNSLSYYGGTFLFQEAVNPANWGLIKTPFGGGQIGTNFILRPSLNYNKRVMDGGESYWCLAFDKNQSTYAMQINDDYVEKAHWSNFINKTFTLSAEHQFKEFVVYSERLAKEEMANHFDGNEISLGADTNTIVGRVNNGITGLGSAFAFTKAGQYGIPEWYDTATEAGDYSVNDGNAMTLNYTISDYVEPDLGIDHSKYESVHIIKKPATLPMGYKYALSAVPYPFNVNHDGASDQYDVSWESSDETIALVIDGMIIPQKTGIVTITATLRGTEISDSCEIKIVNRQVANDISVKISENYISKNGNSFSESDYVMTTNAIYDAITEAYEHGYNHIIFPEMDFYAVPTDTEYHIPSGMTVEFPEGSAFHMMPSEKAKTEGYTYFRMGWGWWSCDIPTEKASVEKDEDGNVLAYYCRDAHLIIDKYYGEFYKEGATTSELYSGANQNSWDCKLLSIGKRAEYCSVEVREANCPTGFFIIMGGKGNAELVNGESGSVAADEFVSGRLNDIGELEENPDWISTQNYYSISKAANGMDTMHEYYIGDWEHNVVTATQRLYDVFWYDEDYNLLDVGRWQYIDEGYSNKPDNAAYFKLSIQQSELPAGTDEYVRLCPDESSRFCEIKNTNVINSATGLASVIGATEACWIHDNYVSGDGLLYGGGRSLDLEDGWLGMRGTIIERNIFRKYGYSGSSDYRGADTGVLALASGYNTFVISNYLGAIQQRNYNVANIHIINNVVHSMYSSFSSGKPNDIRTKISAHTYYNILGQSSNEISANGVNYYYENTIIPTVNLW